MTLPVCLILLRITQLMFGRKARLYGENLSVPQSQSQTSSGELGDVGDSGRLRCLHGKVDSTISSCTIGSTQCCGCVVYGPSAMAIF